MEEENKTIEPEVLDEASAITGAATELPDPTDNSQLGELPTANSWDELYKKYGPEFKAQDYYTIYATRMEAKDPAYNFGNPTGYLQYDTDAGTGKGTKTYRRPWKADEQVDTINDPSALKLVSDPKDASLFTRDDANIFIRAIQKDSRINLRKNKFTIAKQTNDQRGNTNYPALIISKFWQALSGAGDSRFIDNCMSQLIHQCNQRTKSPLVRNSVLQVLSALYKSPESAHFAFDDRRLINLTNIMARNIVKPDEALNPKNMFAACLLYNPHILEDYDYSSFEKLVEIYNKARSLDKEAFKDFLKDPTGKVTDAMRNNYARNLIIQVDEDESTDPISVWLNSGDAALTDDLKDALVNPIPADIVPPTIDSPIRDFDQAQLALQRLEAKEPNDDRDSTARKYVLQVIDGTTVTPYVESSSTIGESVEIKFTDVDYAPNNEVRLIRVLEADKSSTTAVNLFKDAKKSDIMGDPDVAAAFNWDATKFLVAKVAGTDIEVTVTCEVNDRTGKSIPKEMAISTAPTIVDHTVKFDLTTAGGGTIADATVHDGDSYTLPDPTTEGVTPPAGQSFKNWKVGSDDKNPGDAITVTSDLVITPVWQTAIARVAPAVAKRNTLVNAIASGNRTNFDSVYSGLTPGEQEWVKTNLPTAHTLGWC